MITSVIIDDEAGSVLTLRNFLETHCPEVKILGTANNARTGRELIQNKQPQLVFLDIEMPLGSGFDLLNSLPNIGCEVVFITAYNQYAIAAFRFSALDYLLKPLRISELKEAVNKAAKKIEEKKSRHNYELLIRNMQEDDPARRRIALTDRGEQYMIYLSDIMYLIAEGNYTKLVTTTKTFVSSKNLKDFEDLLPDSLFFRIHYGHIVNLIFIDRARKGRGGAVLMKNGVELEIAVRRKDDFMKFYNNNSK